MANYEIGHLYWKTVESEISDIDEFAAKYGDDEALNLVNANL